MNSLSAPASISPGCYALGMNVCPRCGTKFEIPICPRCYDIQPKPDKPRDADA